ncbi:MAG: hypothetical protein IPF71_02085 [Rhodoferax sp.]|nr:hypothetical protein [Rhodoferax sp.]
MAVGGANLSAAWDRLTSGMVPVNGAGVVVAVLDGGYLPMLIWQPTLLEAMILSALTYEMASSQPTTLDGRDQ